MNKISADHLALKACVYIRQSTPEQVHNNLESKRMQYALADRARQLGWTGGRGHRRRPWTFGIWNAASRLRAPVGVALRW